jgi:hypothetical protein
MKKYLSTLLALSIFVFSSCEEEELNRPGKGYLNAYDAKGKKLGKDKGSLIAKVYYAELEAMNDSGVEGSAILTIDGNELTIRLEAEGLEAGKVHMQHIHGFVENKGNAKCPPPSADKDGNGLITLIEAAPYWGTVRVPLSPFSSEATIDYERTFNLQNQDNEAYFNLRPLQNRAIVIHGKTLENGEYRELLPVACGQIKPMPGR